MRESSHSNFRLLLPWLLTAFLGFTSVIFVRCHSSDMGDMEADRMPLNTAGLTSWDHGAGAVIKSKCANCHTAERTQFVPGNTPAMLDGMGSVEFFTDRKNKSLIKAMIKRIETTGPKEMPPRFATPLYPEERAAVLACLSEFLNDMDAKPVATASPSTSPDTSSSQPNPEASSSPPVVQPTPTPTPIAKLKFEDVKPIVMSHCARSGCHDGVDGFPLLTGEDFVDSEGRALEQILSGDMPYGDSGFKDSAAGKKLIEWLSGDLQE